MRCGLNDLDRQPDGKPSWEHDEEGRIIEYSVVRLPDRRITDICRTREEAEECIERHRAWKADRCSEAEANRRELDAAPPLPPTNEPWMDWTKGALGQPPTKDMAWELRIRTVTNWEPIPEQRRGHMSIDVQALQEKLDAVYDEETREDRRRHPTRTVPDFREHDGLQVETFGRFLTEKELEQPLDELGASLAQEVIHHERLLIRERTGVVRVFLHVRGEHKGPRVVLHRPTGQVKLRHDFGVGEILEGEERRAGDIEPAEAGEGEDPLFELLIPEAMVEVDPPKFEDTWMTVKAVRREEGEPGSVIFDLDEANWHCGEDTRVLVRPFQG